MAPGKVEDAKGIPFVGPAGTLLRNELRRTGINPTAAYYMNVVCCMPPNNNPSKSQIDACRGNLKDQLEVADAQWVLACGNHAMETLIPHADSFTRERVIPIHSKRVFCVYHPSYIMQAKDTLLYERWKGALWKFRMGMLGINIEDRGCIYCGEEYIDATIPVCKKHVKTWKLDCKWRYSPPPQLRFEL